MKDSEEMGILLRDILESPGTQESHINKIIQHWMADQDQITYETAKRIYSRLWQGDNQ